MSFLKLPIKNWLSQYQKTFFKNDLIAGVVVGVLLIPQGMAYAMIAGLPPEYGLYAAIAPQIVYAFLGTSPVLAVGPVAMDSLLVALGLSALNIGDPNMYIAAALLLSLLMGVMQFLLGVLRLGVLVNFLSKPVISGFTSAAAFIIATSQLPSLLRIRIAANLSFLEKITSILEQIPLVHTSTALVGLFSVLLIVVLKKINKNIPSGIVLVVVFIGLSYWFDFQSMGIALVGEIPNGFPPFNVPMIDFHLLKELLPIALTLALVAFMETIAVSKSFEEKQNTYEVDANQELKAIGLANMIGSFFSAYPTTGGFSRTAVNYKAGAKTNLSAFMSAFVVIAALLFLTDVFFFLPKASLAALVIVAVSSLVDFHFPVILFTARKDELLVLLITFVGTLFIGVKEGIFIGVLFSLVLMIYRTSKPHIAVLGNLNGSDYYKNINRFESDVTDRNDLLIIRFDAQLYFGNKDYFKNQLQSLAAEKSTSLKAIILNAEAINHIDSSANMMLLKLIENFHKNNVSFYISGVIGPTRDILYTRGVAKLLGENKLFVRTSEAVCYYDSKCSPSQIQKKIVGQNKC